MSVPSKPEPSFRDLENARRTEAARNDADTTRMLDGLNALLAADPLQLVASAGACEPDQPIVLVLGLPRSGTTLLMQMLAAGLDIGYVDCIAARFWRAPEYGLALSRSLSGGQPTFSFESQHGTPGSVFEPHEFSYFWHQWMGTDRVDPYTGAQPEPRAETIDWAGFIDALGRMQRQTARPFLMKGLLARGALAELARRLPRLVLVYIERGMLDVAASLLATRRRYYGDESRWWSLYPPQYEQLKALPPAKQVAGQVTYLAQQFRYELETVAAPVVHVRYHELCANPESVTEQVRSAIEQGGGSVERRVQPLPAQVAQANPEAVLREEELRDAFREFGVDLPATGRIAVPAIRVNIADPVKQRVNLALAAGRLATGQSVAMLEEELRPWFDGAHVACVSSGMAALEMLLSVLGGAARRVAFPSMVCEAVALAADRAGTPYELLDVDAQRMNLPAETEAADVLVVPHLFGAPAPVTRMRAPVVVEDLAHAVGARLNGRLCGTFGYAGILSFYATKLLPGAFGGAVLSRDEALIETVRDLRQYNHRASYRRRFQYPMSDLSAELVRGNLARLPTRLERRRALAAYYDQALSGLNLQRQYIDENAQSAWYHYVLVTDAADRLIEAARARGVEIWRVIPAGIASRTDRAELAVTARLCEGAVALPLYPELGERAQRRVIEAVHACVDED